MRPRQRSFREAASRAGEKNDARIIKNNYSKIMESSDAGRIFGALAQGSRLGPDAVARAGPERLSAREQPNPKFGSAGLLQQEMFPWS